MPDPVNEQAAEISAPGTPASHVPAGLVATGPVDGTAGSRRAHVPDAHPGACVHTRRSAVHGGAR
jgi:hypothetical protein